MTVSALSDVHNAAASGPDNNNVSTGIEAYQMITGAWMPPSTTANPVYNAHAEKPTACPHLAAEWVIQNVAKLATTPTPPARTIQADRPAAEHVVRHREERDPNEHRQMKRHQAACRLPTRSGGPQCRWNQSVDKRPTSSFG